MKKASIFVLSLVMLLSLTACSAVSKVEKLINDIGEVTLDSKDSIQAAQEAFDALSEEEKEKVDNLDTLTAAQSQYETALKEKDYQDAADAFNNGNYEQAITLYSGILGYKDAADKLALSQKAKNYQDAEKAFADGDYETAAHLFEQAGDFNNTTQRLLDAGKALIDNKQYSAAAEILALPSLEGNPEAAKYSEYAQGFICFEENDYTAAQEHFESAGDLLDATEMSRASIIMQAESNLEKGYLNTAEELYLKLPEDYSYNGIAVSDRLATLEKYRSFVEICGIWTCNNMDASVRQTHDSTGLWDQWDGDGWGYDLEVTCILNDDETATINAKANFWHYTNYSSLSKYLKTSNDSCVFTYTGKTVPSKMTYSLDFINEYSGTLTLKNKTFKLDYKITDRNSSMNFTYTYKSFGTYDTLKQPL